MNIDEKIRELLNPRLREIHGTIQGTLSMGDLAVYVGQPIGDAMRELAEFIQTHERQRAVEICDLTIEGLLDRELCARALRDPQYKYPSEKAK